VKDAHIVKITNCDDTFAALTSNGELFIFSVPKAGEADESVSSGKERTSIKPQRVWALRKQFSAVAVRFFDSLFLPPEIDSIMARMLHLVQTAP
jgi:hypothetical protein